MLLTDARRPAWTGPDGELIALARQNPSFWDQAEISEGVELLAAAHSKGSIRPSVLINSRPLLPLSTAEQHPH
jgi:predicted RNA polymerase sigma factor